jgi:hypothetical protein
MKLLTKEWLLKLLPKWDYFCPKCKKTIPKNTHKCPHCGEKYPSSFAIKAPPQVLKDKQALSLYVHEKIFPSLSQVHRDYLAQYFTVIFADTFVNAFTPWTAVQGSPTISQGGGYTNGSNALVCTTSDYWVKKDSLNCADIYASFYIKFSALPSSGAWASFVSLYNSSWLDGPSMNINPNGAWTLWDGTTNYYSSAGDVVPNRYYHVEMRRKPGAGNGIVQVWINGVQTFILNTLTYTGNTDIFRVGLVYNNGDPLTAYVSCVSLADAYIESIPLFYDAFEGTEVQAPLFKDDFSTGTFQKWTTSYAAGVDNAISALDNGAYSNIVTSGNGTASAYIYKDLGAGYTELYSRTYLQFHGVPSVGGHELLFAIEYGTDGGGLTRFILGNDGSGNPKFMLGYRTNTVSQNYVNIDSVTPVQDTEYCVEVYTKIDASNAVATVWINNVLVATVTGFANDTWTAQTVLVGCESIDGTFTGSCSYDNTVIATAPIGSIEPTVETLFEDNIETNSLSKWDSTWMYIAPTNATSHQGTYSIVAGPENTYARKLFTATDNCYAEMYVKFNTLPTSGNSVAIAELVVDGAQDIVVMGIKNVSGTVKWGITYPETVFADTPNPTTGVWYKIRVAADKNLSRRIYVDDVELLSLVGLPWAANCLLVGSWDKTDSITLNIDEVTVKTIHGNFNAWSSAAYGNAAAIVDLPVHEGTYAAEFAALSSGDSSCKKVALPRCKEIYYQFAFNTPLPTSGHYNGYMFISKSGVADLLNCFIAKWGYGERPYVMRLQDGISDNESEYMNLFPYQWYTLEIHLKISDAGQSNGIVEVWLDGNLIINTHNINNESMDYLDQIVIGATEQNDEGFSVRIDKVRVSNSYIGLLYPVLFEDGYEGVEVQNPIFKDDFERGLSALSSWSTSGTPSIVTDVVFNGDYAAKLPASSFIIRSFNARTTVNARTYFKIDASVYTDYIMALRDVSDIGYLYLISDPVHGFYLNYRKSDNTTRVDVYPVTPFYCTPDTWYCLEIKIVCSPTVGEIHLSIEGVAIIAQTALDVGGQGDGISKIQFNGSTGANTYIDNVVVNNVYIGTLYYNFNAWSDVYGSAAIATNPVHNGEHSLLSSAEGSTVSKELNNNVDLDEVYVSEWFYFPTLPTRSTTILWLWGGASAGVYIGGTTGQVVGQVSTDDDYLTGVNIEAGKWNNILFHAKKGYGENGILQIWLNNTLIIDVTTSSQVNGVHYLTVGNGYSDGTEQTVYVDDIVVSYDPIIFSSSLLWSILGVSCDPVTVIRVGSNVSTLRCDFTDPTDLAAGSYTCRLFTRGPTGTIYGPYTATVVKDSTGTYHATYDWNPDDNAEVGTYDLKAQVYRS